MTCVILMAGAGSCVRVAHHVWTSLWLCTALTMGGLAAAPAHAADGADDALIAQAPLPLAVMSDATPASPEPFIPASTPAPAASAAAVPASAAAARVASAATQAHPARTQSAAALAAATPARAMDLRLPLPEFSGKPGETASAVRVVLALTLLALIPSMLVCLTAFLRIVIVLSLLRQAIGMPETPPNTVVIGLALFLTLFTMNPVLEQVNAKALQPFLDGRINIQQGLDGAAKPLREFMIRQTREQDIALIVGLSKGARPSSMDEVGNLQLVPAFMLSELRAAFQIGFVIFLPFLLIDLIVSSILMSLGMMMMPPVTVALPVKILMFVLVDGWALVIKALVGSFH